MFNRIKDFFKAITEEEEKIARQWFKDVFGSVVQTYDGHSSNLVSLSLPKTIALMQTGAVIEVRRGTNQNFIQHQIQPVWTANTIEVFSDQEGSTPSYVDLAQRFISAAQENRQNCVYILRSDEERIEQLTNQEFVFFDSNSPLHQNDSPHWIDLEIVQLERLNWFIVGAQKHPFDEAHAQILPVRHLNTP